MPDGNKAVADQETNIDLHAAEGEETGAMTDNNNPVETPEIDETNEAAEVTTVTDEAVNNAEEGTEATADTEPEEGTEATTNTESEEGTEVTANTDTEEGTVVTVDAEPDAGPAATVNTKPDAGKKATADTKPETGTKATAEPETKETDSETKAEDGKDNSKPSSKDKDEPKKKGGLLGLFNFGKKKDKEKKAKEEDAKPVSQKKNVVVGTTTLIALSRLGRLNLLKKMYGEVMIPNAVYEGLKGIIFTRRNKEELEWIKVEKVSDPKNRRHIRDGLSISEIEVLLLAQEKKSELVITDDYLTRKNADELALNVSGTIGFLIKAEELKAEDEAIYLLDELDIRKIYLGESLRRQIKALPW